MVSVELLGAEGAKWALLVSLSHWVHHFCKKPWKLVEAAEIGIFGVVIYGESAESLHVSTGVEYYGLVG